MAIAASDYDGTLFREDKVAEADAAAIGRWRAAGHKFGVVSGRDYGMLAPQLTHYGVASDYTVCNNGGLLLGADGKVLWQASLSLPVLKEIAALPEVRRSRDYAFSAADCTYICHELGGGWLAREAAEWDFPLRHISEEDILSLPRIHQFSLAFLEEREAAAAAEAVNARFGEQVHAYQNRCSVDITPPEVSKRTGIEKLLELMGWQQETVYAIGDEINDLPMLEAFRGYTVDTARPAIKSRTRGSYASVGALLDAKVH